MKDTIFINNFKACLFNEKEILNDFDIFEIKVDIDRKIKTSYSILKALKELTNDLYAIKYYDSNYAFALVKKDAITKTQIEDKIKKEYKCNVIKIKTILNDMTANILSLILFETAYNSRISNEIIVNDSFCKIIKFNAKQIVTLSVKFHSNYFSCNVNTFTKCSVAKKEKNTRYIINGNVMSKVHDYSGYSDDELYVLKNMTKHKNIIDTFNGSPLEVEKNKFAILNEVYTLLNNSKYIKKLELENIEMIDAQKNIFSNIKNTNIFTDFTKNNCLELINTIGLNIVFQNNIIDKQIEETLSEKIGIKNIKIDKDVNKKMLNLYITDCSLAGKDLESDEIYKKNKEKDVIIQHIGRDNFSGSLPARLKTCLYQLVLKYEIKNNQINSFDWETFKKHSKSKFYIFYSYIKIKNEKSEEEYYCELKMDNSGKILEFKKENYPFGYATYCNEKTYIIENDKGDIISISDTDLFMMPNVIELSNEIDSIKLGKNEKISYEVLHNFLQKLSYETTNKDVKETITNIYKIFPNLDLEDFKNVEINFNDIVLELKNNGFSSTKGMKIIKKSLEEYYTIELLKTPRWCTRFKSMEEGKTGSKIYPGIINIHYNEQYYMVSATESFKTGKTLTNNILLRNINVLEGDNFFEELLLMLMNPIVKTDMLTVYPFVYKYIREMV